MNTVKSETVSMRQRFGDFCAVGDIAVEYLISDIYPVIDQGGEVVFDFAGVRNMNSSFSNAIFANLFRRYGREVVSQVKVTNTRSNVRTEILSSFSLARGESKEPVAV